MKHLYVGFVADESHAEEIKGRLRPLLDSLNVQFEFSDDIRTPYLMTPFGSFDLDQLEGLVSGFDYYSSLRKKIGYDE